MQGAIDNVRKWCKAVGGTLTRALSWFELKPRPAQLLFVVASVVGVGLALDGASGWQVWTRLFYPRLDDVAQVRFWSALVYNLALVMGLPIAFLVWHWRDKNARDQIEQQKLQVENARKDTNLKEFQEVQGRAVGLFDEKIPAGAREQLQISALHQLRGFLRGEYGDAFRRPAFEIILAGHAEAMERIEIKDVQDQIRSSETELDILDVQQLNLQTREKLDRVMRERIGIIRDEAESIFRSGFPLSGRTWDLCEFTSFEFPDGLNLSRSSFTFATLRNVSLAGVDLEGSHFEGANLYYAKLRLVNLRRASLGGANLHKADLARAQLSGAKLDGADLSDSDLSGAVLARSRLRFADLSSARLCDADFTGAALQGSTLTSADLNGIKLSGARFDDQTEFIDRWEGSAVEEIAEARRNFRALGARHVDDDENDEPLF